VPADPSATGAVADDAVLDELSAVFGDGASASERADDRTDDRPRPGDGPSNETGDEPDEPDDPTGDGPDDPTGDDLTEPPRPVLVDPGLVAVARAPQEGSPEPASSGRAGAVRTIRIGADEELPDAPYLDEELERAGTDGHDGPIFIDDDDTDDAIVASEAAVGGVDHRIRQRRIGVRRAAGRRRLKWLLIAGGVIMAVVAALAVLASSLFSINQIAVTGNRYTDPAALTAVIADLEGTPVLLADSASYEEQLEEIPWVEDARVRTSFPNSATIDIRERTPVAAMPGADGQTRVLDEEGRVLDVIEGQPIALAWISGPITLDIPAGHFAAPGPTWAAALVPKFTPTIRPRVDSMQVTPDGSDLRIYLRPAPIEPAGGADGDATTAAGGAPPPAPESPALYVGPLIEVRFGSAIGDSQQIEKLVRLERVLTDVDTRLVSVIDVSTSEVTVL
jgi:cell division protein FtsQ